MTTKQKLGRLGLFVLSAQALVYAIDIAIRHGSDAAWPGHARYHLVVSATHVAATGLAIALLAWSGDIFRSKSSWAVLAVLVLLGWLAWPLGRIVTAEPTAPMVMGLLAALLVESAVLLFLAYPAVSRPGPPA